MQKIFTLDYIEVLSNPLQNNTALVEHEKGDNSQWAPKRHDSLGMLICTIEEPSSSKWTLSWVNAVILKPKLQRPARYSQYPGSMGTIAAGLFQGPQDHLFLDFLERSTRS
jgi:hypothetical protein